jgi:hypothetical protein
MHWSTVSWGMPGIWPTWTALATCSSASISSLPYTISDRMICLPKFVIMSKQFCVISRSAKSTNNETTISTTLKHFIKWCSFYLAKDRFLRTNKIDCRWFIRVSSETSWCSTVTSFFRFLRSSSNTFYSSRILDLVLRPRFLCPKNREATSSDFIIYCMSWCRILTPTLVNIPKFL